MNRLDRYVAGYFLSSFLVSVVLFVGLLGVYDFFNHVDDLVAEAAGRQPGLDDLGRLYMLQLPAFVAQTSPFILVMAALVTVLRLQRHNELLAMTMTGQSPGRSLRMVVLATVVAVVGLVVLQEIVAPRVAVERDRLRATLFGGKDEYVLARVTLRDAADRQLVAHEYHVAEERITRLSMSFTDAAGRNVHVTGENATWDPQGRGWRLENGTSEIRSPDGEPGPSRPAAFVETDIRPDDLLADSLESFDLRWADVLDRVRRYPTSRKNRMLLHYKVTYPLSVLLLVFLALPFVVRRPPGERMKGLGWSLLLVLGFLFVDTTARDLGMRGTVQPVLAAWAPVILAGSFIVVLQGGGEPATE